MNIALLSDCEAEQTIAFLGKLTSTDVPGILDKMLQDLLKDNKRPNLVKSLLQNERVNPADTGNQAILFAAANGRTEVVKFLLQDPRVNPTCSSNYPIRSASGGGHTETVKLLLSDPRINPTDLNNDAIDSASRNGRTDV